MRMSSLFLVFNPSISDAFRCLDRSCIMFFKFYFRIKLSVSCRTAGEGLWTQRCGKPPPSVINQPLSDVQSTKQTNQSEGTIWLIRRSADRAAGGSRCLWRHHQADSSSVFDQIDTGIDGFDSTERVVLMKINDGRGVQGRSDLSALGVVVRCVMRSNVPVSRRHDHHADNFQLIHFSDRFITVWVWRSFYTLMMQQTWPDTSVTASSAVN